MRDLLTNIKKAVEILNKNKNLNLSLSEPETIINDQVPVGVSYNEWAESIKEIIKGLVFVDLESEIVFDCSFDIADLRVEEDHPHYILSMQTIMKTIYEAYKLYKSMLENGLVSLSGGQTITGSKTYNSTGTWTSLSLGNSTNTFSSIYADDVMLDGSTSVKSTIDDLEQKNQNLQAQVASLTTQLQDILEMMSK